MVNTQVNDRQVVSYRFKDTGRLVGIKKVSPMLAAELRRSFPPPKPPMEEVDYGDGKKVLEPNSAHPGYQSVMEDYNQQMNERVQRLLIKRGVVVAWDDEKKQEVADLRSFWKEEYATELQGSDVEVYVNHICVGTQEDLQELIQAITQRSGATEEVIQSHLETFPDKV